VSYSFLWRFLLESVRQPAALGLNDLFVYNLFTFRSKI